MALLAPNWDSYGAEPPNARSRALATCILGLLQRQVLSPTRIVASAEGGSVAFFGVDADGLIRPGAWTYGQTSNRPSAYGRRFFPPVVTLDLEAAALEQRYILALW